jgi:hypothetical protein
VSARTIRSGLAATTYSDESCGYPKPSASASSAMLRRPSDVYTWPMKVFDVAE